MSKIKNWIMEENGASNTSEVLTYVESKMNTVDKNYVSKVYQELDKFGSYPRLTL